MTYSVVGQPESKEWAFKLTTSGSSNYLTLQIVDKHTGKTVANVMSIDDRQGALFYTSVKSAMEDKGYNTSTLKFDSFGALVVVS